MMPLMLSYILYRKVNSMCAWFGLSTNFSGRAEKCWAIGLLDGREEAWYAMMGWLVSLALWWVLVLRYGGMELVIFAVWCWVYAFYRCGSRSTADGFLVAKHRVNGLGFEARPIWVWSLFDSGGDWCWEWGGGFRHNLHQLHWSNWNVGRAFVHFIGEHETFYRLKMTWIAIDSNWLGERLWNVTKSRIRIGAWKCVAMCLIRAWRIDEWSRTYWQANIAAIISHGGEIPCCKREMWRSVQKRNGVAVSFDRS